MSPDPSTNLTFGHQLEEMLLVGLGAVPGALLRWQANLYFGDQNLVMNVLGAALLGFLAGTPAAPKRQLLLGVGFCGSVTTFSSWMLATMNCIFSDDWGQAIGLVCMTMGLGLGAASLGFSVARTVNIRRS